VFTHIPFSTRVLGSDEPRVAAVWLSITQSPLTPHLHAH